MVDERAILEIAVEVSEGINRLEKLEQEFVRKVGRMNDALARIDDEEAEELRREIAAVGDEFERTADKAEDGLRQIARSGKVAEESIEQMDREIKQTRTSIGAARKAMATLGTTARRAANQARQALGGLRQAVLGLRGAFLAVGGAVILNEITKATERQAQAEAVLNQLIISTGKAAGFTADELKKMAAGLQQVTLFGDEAVIEGQNILLTFTKIGREVFPDTIEAAANLATLMAQGTGGQPSLKDAAIQLGKALNDPVKNLSALSRAGIQFSVDQTELIKKLFEGGQEAEAQRLILVELEKQFGGTARAARERLGGDVAALKNILGDLGEAIGVGLLPSLDRLASELADGVGTGEAAEKFEAFGKVLGTIVTSVATLVTGLATVRPIVQGFGAGIIKVFEGIIRAGDKLLGLFARIPGVGGRFREARVEIQKEADILAEAAADLGRRSAEGLRDARESIISDWEAIRDSWKGGSEDAETAAAAVLKVGDAAGKTSEELAKIPAEAPATSESLEELGESASSAATGFEELSQAAEAAQAAVSQQQGAVDGVTQSVSALEAELQQLRDTPVLTEEQSQRLQQVTDDLFNQRGALADAERELQARQAALTNEQGRGEAATEGLARAADDASQAFAGEFDAVAQVSDSLRDQLPPAAAGATAALRELEDGSLELQNTIGENAAEFEKAADGSLVLKDAVGETADEMEDLGRSAEKAGAGASQAARGIEELTRAGDAEGLAATRKEIEALQVSLEALRTDAARAGGAVTAAAGDMTNSLSRAVAECERLNACLRELGS